MISNKYIHRGLFGLCALAFSILAAGPAMANGIWDGGGTNSNWSTPENWSDNIVPGTGGTPYTFAGDVQNTSNNDLSGRNVNAFSFTNDGAAGKTNGFVLNGSNSITLYSNISSTASSSVITDTINLNLIFAGTRIFNTGTNHHLSLNGNIGESGASGLTKQQAGTLTLSGDNTYTGLTAISGGTLSISSIADSVSGSNIGFGNLRIGSLNLGFASLNYTGDGSTTSRTVQIGGGNGSSGATIAANGANGGTGLNFAASNFNTLDPDPATNNRTLTLTGNNTDANTISGTIQNAKASGVLNLTKNGSGTWNLSGANTYTGATTVTAGTLVFRNTSAKSVGTTVTAAAEGTVGLGVGAVSGDYTDANIDALFNTNTLAGFNLNPASGVAIDTTAGNFTQSSTLTATRALTKLGANTLSLTGINTYSGATSIPEGTLEVKVLSDVATASSLGAPNLAASVIRLGNAGSTGTLTYTGSGSDTNRQIQIGSGTGTSEAGGGTIRSSGAGILEFTNAAFNSPVNTGTGNGTTLTTRTLTLGGTNTGYNRIAGVIANNLQSETPIVAVVKQDAGTWVLEGANTYTGSTLVSAGKLLVSGSLDASSSVTVATGAILSGAGTVAGPITAAGTIAPGNAVVGVLNAGPTTLTGILAVQIGSAGGDKLLSSGAINITGATLTVNLLPGGVTQTSYVIAEGTSLTGTFASVPSGYSVSYTSTQAILTKDTYDDWLALNAPANGFDTDTDGDGISNGVEYVLGSNPNTYSSGITLTSSTASSVTYQHPLNPTIANDVSYSYEWSTDLIEWKASGETNSGGTSLTINAGSPVSGIVTVTLTGSATKRFIRLKASLPSTQIFQNGTNQLIVYSGVPGATASEFYKIRVRSNLLTNNQWKSAFALITRSLYSQATIPKPGGTHMENYYQILKDYSFTYANIEMNSPVEVEISKVSGAPITKATVHPTAKGRDVRLIGGKAYFFVDNPAQVTVDIDGKMDDQYTGGGSTPGFPAYAGPAIHTVAIFANPIMDKPLVTDPGVVVVKAGEAPPTDPIAYTTLYFAAGVHDIGRDFQVYAGRKYYISGDALLYGTMNNYDQLQGLVPGGIKYGDNIKIYGVGTLSGDRVIHPLYDPVLSAFDNTIPKDGYNENCDETNQYRWKPIAIDKCTNVVVEGVSVMNAANHAINLKPYGANYKNAQGQADPTVDLTFVRWAKIVTWRGNGDGVGSTDLVEDSFIRTADDGAYVRGDRRRCIFWKEGGAQAMVMSWIPNNQAIVIEDCDVLYARSFAITAGGSVFSHHGTAATGVTTVNVTFRNIRIEDKYPTKGIFNLVSGGSYTGITFQNITAAAESYFGNKSVITGTSTAPWSGITFDNVWVAGQKYTSLSQFNSNAYATGIIFK